MSETTKVPSWEHFEHEADIGIRGLGTTLAQAFEQAAVAMTAVICDPVLIRDQVAVAIRCESPDNEFLFLDWVNELIYTMAVKGFLFNRYEVTIDAGVLTAKAFGEPVDRQKHQPAVEIKGATLTELHVQQLVDGNWVAQCVVDV
ncbi:MAG: archease [Gammaproteobacteria bacterium]